MTKNHFKLELTAAFRAVAGNKDAQMVFASAPKGSVPEVTYNPASKTATVFLPEKYSQKDIQIARGESDAIALQLMHHDSKTHAKLAPEGHARVFLDRLEHTRVELLGAETMAGVESNLTARWDARLRKQKFNHKSHLHEVPAYETLSLLLWQAAGHDVPQAADLIMQSLGKIMSKKLGKQLDQLASLAENQTAFSQLVLQLSKSLHMEAEADESEESTRKVDSPDGVSEHDANEINEDQMAESDTPVVSDAAKLETADLISSNDTEHEKPPPETPPEASGSTLRPTPKESNIVFLYQPYTTEFDEIVRPKDIASKEELARYRNQLERKLQEVKDITGRLAIRLRA